MIEPHPNAPEGEVLSLSSYSPSDFRPGSLVLCRNTAPLVGLAYALLQRDVPCRILGRDIGAQLVALVKKLRGANLEDLREKLRVWTDREASRAIAEDRNPERIYDQSECLRFFMNSLDEDSRTIESLIAKIELMFEDSVSTSKVTLSTVHKAKGLEFPTVFILDKDRYMPSRFARLPWQREQERNLIYVAVTRAMEKLVYINSDSWKQKE